MAFAFFRRRQKLVIIIMAVLMVAFLIGFQGMESILSGGRGEQTVGTGRWGELTRREVESANSDIHLLNMLGLGRQQYMGAVPTSVEFNALIVNEELDAALAYALLLQEARNDGLAAVSEDDVDRFLEALGYTGAQYERLVTQLSDRAGQGEEILHAAIVRWLSIVVSFQNSASSTVPSEPELRHAFRDLSEEINLLVGEFRAVDFLEDVTQELTDEEILEQYNKYRTRPADTFESPEDFGFGYRRPDRVGISYLFVNREVVDRVARPTRAEAMDYWQEHPDEFVREVPVNGDAEGESTEYRTEPMDFASAEPLIVEKLAPEVAERKVEDLLLRADRILQDIPGDSETDPYVQVRRRMQRSAEVTLERRVTVRIAGDTLRRAIEKLADAADLGAICYPWGDMGGISIDPAVEITLPLEQTTDAALGDVLELITAQLLGDEQGQESSPEASRINWAHCAELDSALFPVGGELEMFPVTAGRTGLLSVSELLRQPILGNAYTSQQGGEGLWRRAFDARGFGERGAMNEGDPGSRMFVRGPDSGRLLWRLSEVSPAHDAPQAEAVTEIPADLLEDVRRDLRLMAAMEIAHEHADEAVAEGGEGNIRESLEQSTSRVFETGLFSRKTYGLQWRGIPQMRVGSRDVLRHMVQQAFELAPREVADSDEPSAARVLEFPPRRSVAVLQRIGYSPAIQTEYEQMRPQLVGLLRRNRIVETCFEWFDSDNVIRRAQFKSTDEAL